MCRTVPVRTCVSRSHFCPSHGRLSVEGAYGTRSLHRDRPAVQDRLQTQGASGRHRQLRRGTSQRRAWLSGNGLVFHAPQLHVVGSPEWRGPWQLESAPAPPEAAAIHECDDVFTTIARPDFGAGSGTRCPALVTGGSSRTLPSTARQLSRRRGYGATM
jgi:hypothetical protein